MRILAILFAGATGLLVACTGNIGDIFSSFPKSVFEPDQPGDGGGRPPIPGGFQPIEIGFAESAQGVTGDVRNVELLSFGSQSLAFCTAGTDGVHIVDVSRPDRIPAAVHLATIGDASLTAPAAIDGGRVDSIAIVDGTYLVCVAVGTSAANAVTVFHIPTLVELANAGTPDLSPAYIAKQGVDIAVPGNAAGKAGGVSGLAGSFVVATGGPELGIGAILNTTPQVWVGLPPTTMETPPIEEFLDVKVGIGAIYTSVRSQGAYGILAAQITITPNEDPLLPPNIDIIQAAPDITEILGSRFGSLENDKVTGPGNFFLDLSLDIGLLYVTGDDRVHSFSITSPTNPGIGPVADFTGLRTISVAAQAGTFAVGNRDEVRVYTSLTGQPTLQAQFEFPNALRQIRGVALLSAPGGRYVVCCAGQRGLRLVQWSQS